MDTQLFTQLKSWNPWWERGPAGMNSYQDPVYKRELFDEVLNQFLGGDQIVSVVGMRQVGKSTMMRQVIRHLLDDGVDAKRIFYISFDDPFLRAQYDPKRLFDEVIRAYTEGVLHADLRDVTETLFFFFDEVHQLPNWERALKSYYDRRYPIRYFVSGSSSLHLQKKNRESLLGRISEHTLWPFSFREYVEFSVAEKETRERLSKSIEEARNVRAIFLKNFSLGDVFSAAEPVYRDMAAWDKQTIINLLRSFVIDGGFPRVWQQQDLASKHRTLWEQYVGKTLFEDLLQVAKIRRVRDLEFLFVRLLGFNGKEVKLNALQKELKMSYVTLDRYLGLFIKTFLLFRVERTKSHRLVAKRRSGSVKFYVTDPALRNALYKRDDSVFDDAEEMSFIAETLVCSTAERWITPVRGDDRVGYYADRGEVDFVFKYGSGALPIEVKWRNDIPTLKTLDALVKKWDISESMVVTKDFDMTYRNGRLSIPLWFFLMVF